jgi:two-component system, OmpR family, sensor histidine kinase KdpD
MPMDENTARPNPDELLARVQAEEAKIKRGKLKIFLGYAAGVGKTYSMLQDARSRSHDTDLVVGIVETHKRLETAELVQGLEIITNKKIEYRGVTLSEMDIDAVLARHPQLVLVDELAHTNAPGSRHPKRYQDVIELLDAGIDVYTTLNVQHIESLRDTVEQITGISMHETIPDTVIDTADEIRLVDLPPDELLQRLKEGKVYVPEQVAHAMEDFFRKGNLTALRELTMRAAAERVDEQVRSYMYSHSIRGPWATGERLMVCISPSSSGSRLVRTARRLSTQLAAEWFAVYVETPDNLRLSPGQLERLATTLRLAEEMGAKAVTIQGNSISEAVIDYAIKNNITKIVVGKPLRRRWLKLRDEVVLDRIIHQSEDIDVYVVSGGGEPASHTSKDKNLDRVVNWRGYLQGLILVGIATLIGRLINQLFTPATIMALYVLAVGITAYLGGLGPSIMVSFVGVLVFDFFFVRPYFSFSVSDTQYLFTFFVLILVGMVISYLTERVRRQTEAAKIKERETYALFALGRDLAVSNDLESYMQVIIKRAQETFGHEVIAFLPDPEKKNNLKPFTGVQNLVIDENERSAAIWAFEHQKIVGSGTDTLPNSKARFIPLVTARGKVGVLAILVTGDKDKLTIGQEHLLEAYADLAAVAIESILLNEESHNAQIMRDTEKLQTALLNSVSHDLRTPLVSIIGVLSSLQEGGIHLDDAAKAKLVNVAWEEAERLNHLITNLLDVSRVEAGAIRILRQASDVQDLVGTALEQLGNRTVSRPIEVDITPDLPFVSVDFGLIVQTLVNIIDNALKYSPTDSAIEIKARRIDNEVQIEIADRGFGIPPGDLLQVFDKFYRIEHPGSVAGTGLGLSICKGIVEAHGGRILAENRAGGGTIIRLILPAAENDQKPDGQAHA